MYDRIAQFLSAYNLFEVAFELAIIWLFVYFLFRFLENTRGAGVLRGLVVVAVVLTVVIKFIGESTHTLERLGYIYQSLVGVLATLLIVVFQPELRQGMIRLGEVFTRGGQRAIGVVEEVEKAAEFLSRNQFGAILVFERSIALGSIVEGGVRLDAVVSARLIESIFYPNNPLHDLAVVIRGDRVLAANVQLPLADVGMVPPELGSRHRAAVGVTVETDAVVVAVSEERGTIRIAERGRLSAPIERSALRDELARRLLAPPAEGDANAPSEASDTRAPAALSGAAGTSARGA